MCYFIPVIIAIFKIFIEFFHALPLWLSAVLFQICHFGKSPVMPFRIENRVIAKTIKAFLLFPDRSLNISGKRLTLTFRNGKCDTADKSGLSVLAIA